MSVGTEFSKSFPGMLCETYFFRYFNRLNFFSIKIKIHHPSNPEFISKRTDPADEMKSPVNPSF
jgi:hypothetical protein